MSDAQPTVRPLWVAIGLGSNMPPADRTPFSDSCASDARLRALEGALVALRAKGLRPLATSRVHETKPVGTPDAQPDYLNACIIVETHAGLAKALAACQDVERLAGRGTKGDLAARPLDLDILAAWKPARGTVPRLEPPWSCSGLVVPHPRLAERAFVLVPLVQLAGDWPLPPQGGRDEPATASTLLDGLGSVRGVRPGPPSERFPWRATADEAASA